MNGATVFLNSSWYHPHHQSNHPIFPVHLSNEIHSLHGLFL